MAVVSDAKYVKGFLLYKHFLSNSWAHKNFDISLPTRYL